MQGLNCVSTRVQQLNREPNQIHATLQLKFLLEVGAIGLDGFDATVEFFGNLASAEAQSDQVQDSELALTKACDRRGVDALWRSSAVDEDE